MNQLSTTHKLLIAALSLGFLAAFGPDPYANSYAVIDVKDLGMQVDREVARIEPADLADRLLQGTTTYRLIDLRSQAKYAENRIPGAANLSVADLLAANHLKREALLIYGADEVQAARAWFLLTARGFQNVALVAGGLKGWEDEVLFPTLPADATTEQRAAFEKAKVVSLRFGGTPRLAGGTEAAVGPSVAAPPPVIAPAAIAVNGGGRKKKREGC